MTLKPQYTLQCTWLGRSLASLGLLALSACADLGYYLQSAQGHLAMMHSAKPVDDWLADPSLTPALKRQLELAQRIRRFAVTELALPDNPSYTRYADLNRGAVIWNVVASPELALTLKTWCFPVAGCVGYRGYFDEAQAKQLALALQSEGLEASVYGVPAYSTLGWMNWAGGDPLLNTFIHYPEPELARLIFHELAHQVVYAKDDTTFNESFATAVERLGGARWQAQNAGNMAVDVWAGHAQRRQQFRALTQATRRDLTQIYEKNSGAGRENAEKLASKKMAMDNFRSDYARLRANWLAASASAPAVQSLSGYDNWVAKANNASFAAQAAYDSLVPQFEALHGQSASWPAFYDAVKRLAELAPAQRSRVLADLVMAPAGHASGTAPQAAAPQKQEK